MLALAPSFEALPLLIALRMRYGSPDEQRIFPIPPRVLARAEFVLTWKHWNRYLRATQTLIEKGLLEQTHKGGGPGNQSQYRFTDPTEAIPIDQQPISLLQDRIRVTFQQPAS